MSEYPSIDRPASLTTLGDKVLVAAIGISFAAAIVLGMQFADSGLAIACSLALLLIAALGYAAARGTMISRYVLTFVLVSFVALHIQLAKGMIELHFGVFVVLAFLLVYRDWKVIVFGAAVHERHQFSQYRAGRQSGGDRRSCYTEGSSYAAKCSFGRADGRRREQFEVAGR